MRRRKKEGKGKEEENSRGFDLRKPLPVSERSSLVLFNPTSASSNAAQISGPLQGMGGLGFFWRPRGTVAFGTICRTVGGHLDLSSWRGWRVGNTGRAHACVVSIQY